MAYILNYSKKTNISQQSLHLAKYSTKHQVILLFLLSEIELKPETPPQ